MLIYYKRQLPYGAAPACICGQPKSGLAGPLTAVFHPGRCLLSFPAIYMLHRFIQIPQAVNDHGDVRIDEITAAAYHIQCRRHCRDFYNL